MTRTFKKTIQLFLISVFAVALLIGTWSLVKPQNAKAADTAVTFNVAYIEGDNAEKTGYLQVRMDTVGETWTNSANNKTVSEIQKSVADYTTINGRTLTELQEASTSDLPVIVTLQPAGSFSFIRVWVPLDFMQTSMVKSIGVLDGWAFNDGKANYTSKTTTFLRTGDTMLEASAYSSSGKTKVSANDITISKAYLTLPDDSYLVDINMGVDMSGLSYEVMGSTCNELRNAIYINGKSINEWNEQLTAEDPRFLSTATYAKFPQNSNTAGHEKFIRPIAIYGTATGFHLRLFQELFVECETVTVKVGSGCYHSTFMVTGTKAENVLEQIDITDKLAFLDNTHNDSSNNTTNSYYIHTSEESMWQSAPIGGCLNEYDPLNMGGGQIQMKYIYFNGTSLYDINVNDNDAHGSQQGTILGNGGIYAPILVEMTDELGSTLRLRVPMNFTNGKAGHEEISIKKGFSVMANGKSYYVSRDVIFTNTGSGWSKSVKATEIETRVVGIKTYANRNDGGTNENFVFFQLSKNDYAGLNTVTVSDLSSLYGYIDIDGNVLSSRPNEPYFNVWNESNTIAFRAPGLSAAQLQQVRYITIKAGAKFPAYSSQSGGQTVYYVTTEDVTFIHSIPNDTWTVGSSSVDPTEYTVTFNVDGSVYHTTTVVSGSTVTAPTAPTKDADANYTYTFKQWNLSGSAYDFSTPVTSNITLDAEFTATAVGNPIVTFMVDGSVYYTTSVASGSYFSKVTLPENPTKLGYNFSHWSDVEGGNKINDFKLGKITSNLTVYAVFELTGVDVSDDFTFIDQGTSNGTEVYLLKISNNYWTSAATINGCLNDYVANGGGEDQLSYIYFNGRSIQEINDGDNESYGSTQDKIATGGIYAPIVVFAGTDGGNYSYVQLHVPTGYPNVGCTADENHKSISIKAGFKLIENGITFTVNKDLTWYNINGSWKSASEILTKDNFEFRNARQEGAAHELYKIDIYSTAWSINCNYYDFMLGGEFVEYRENIFINGVSIYDINASVDDSSYVYSTFPMTHNDQESYGHPVLIVTNINEGSGDPYTLTLWIHENYVKSLNYDVTVTLGAGFNAYTSGICLGEDVSYTFGFNNVTINNGSITTAQIVLSGDKAIAPTPSKSMTSTAMYEFENWYIANTNTVFNFATPITSDVSIEARFIETALSETQLDKIVYSINEKNNADRWLLFYLTEHDYPEQTLIEIQGMYDELLALGMFDNIIIRGEMTVGGVAKTEATMREIFDANGYGEAIFMNIWRLEFVGTLAFRVPGVSVITEIEVKSGCVLPSYKGLEGEDHFFAVLKDSVYRNSKVKESGDNYLLPVGYDFDINMEAGASVRITSDMKTSGLRFQTNISKETMAKLQALKDSGEFTEISFGTLIVPTDYLMGGLFTHEWFNNNNVKHLDIKCTANLENMAWPKETTDYYSFFGSIVALKEKNYNRAFSGLGYIKIVDKGGEVTYVYAHYDSANSRSASFVAKAATADRSNEQTEIYENKIENTWSPYTQEEHTFLSCYIVWASQKEVVEPEELNSLAEKGGTATITIEQENRKLNGPYVELVYSTNVNVWGVFTYTDGNTTANEDFYLQAGTSSHKQYLDLFRNNGVGYGMEIENLSMVSIKFTNAELKQTVTGKVKILGFYSKYKTEDPETEIGQMDSEVHVTVAQDGGSEMTVGAHLGIGGSLTYLAKSGVYEGVIGGSSGWKNGTVAISEDPSVFGNGKNKYKSGKTSSSYSEEDAYYGSATSSKPEDGAVNLINNFDAGRQFQQSWYAQVGGSETATAGENGYTRAYCYTGSVDGQYWPYNPVQAGDVVSNPAQIIDYEVTANYIYVKARPMDWAKGYDPDQPCVNAVEGGVTTKSYVENYYRLNSDGTLVVNNKFVDWNGFTDMELCDWAPTELPACYPVHTLNYYVSNIDGTWGDAVEFNPNLEGWTTNPYCQFTDSAQGATKYEEWFAWANGGTMESFGLGVYIPNVTRFTSGRTNKSTAYYTDTNFQNSNALPVPEYKEFNLSSFSQVSMVSENAQRGNILADKGLMKGMQDIIYTYQSAYVSNTSYTAPGINYKMEAYVPIEYSYVICLGSVSHIRETFNNIYDKGTITNAGGAYEKVGLDAWTRDDKAWT